MNNFLALGAVVACGWVASNVVLLEPAARSVSSRPMTVAAPAYAFHPIVGRDVVESRRAPVPLIRSTRPPVVIPTSIDTSLVSADAVTVSAEQKAQDDEKAQDDIDRKAAKAAVEADGYKRASLVGKASNGSWRAKAYRGTTEVWLTVDGTGGVSLD
jgi:hypothetical protein